MKLYGEIGENASTAIEVIGKIGELFKFGLSLKVCGEYLNYFTCNTY